jgi:hypothetical protein
MNQQTCSAHGHHLTCPAPNLARAEDLELKLLQRGNSKTVIEKAAPAQPVAPEGKAKSGPGGFKLFSAAPPAKVAAAPAAVKATTAKSAAPVKAVAAKPAAPVKAVAAKTAVPGGWPLQSLLGVWEGGSGGCSRHDERTSPAQGI